LFGIAFGNIFQGLAMDADGYHGNLFTLLNPYGILTGLVFVLLFVVRGSLWIALKTEGDLSKRASELAGGIWYTLLMIAVIFLASTKFATDLYANYFRNVILLIVPVVAVLSLIGIKVFVAKGHILKAFFSSCLTIVAVIFTGVVGLYPNLIPSNTDPRYSLTIFNSSSSAYTLKIMTVVALLFVPVVIAYQIWTYRVFRHKATDEEIASEGEYY
jgi:cytochrome d ubiquinol oxidase subunit II